MKYRFIKMYESFFDNQDELKKLHSHIILIMNELGYTYENYLDSGSWETEFYKDTLYSICFKFKIDTFSKNHFIRMITVISLRNTDPFATFIVKYLKTIKGIKVIKEEYNIGSMPVNDVEFKILDKDVDKIIKQININDIELKFNANKYNL